MRNKIPKWMMIVLVVLLAASAFYIKARIFKKDDGLSIQEIRLSKGLIEKTISSTGTVLPKNRLEIMPPVNGRVEEVKVKEGQKVKIGDVLAEMSSTERAALLDAARGKGEEDLKYWKNVYKAILLVSPIDAEVIVATTQPGQTITTSDAVVVLSDHLIVRAQVDETDIGKIKLKQRSVIILDAYPDIKINAKVEHIYYESETVNNVTVYKVDLLPDQTPVYFRSGMNATVDFKVESKESVLLIPVNAVYKKAGGSYCLVRPSAGKDPVEREIELGISDDKNYEIVSGVNADDTVVVATKKYILPASSQGSNPFLPKFSGSKKSQGGPI